MWVTTGRAVIRDDHDFEAVGEREAETLRAGRLPFARSEAIVLRMSLEAVS